MQSHEIKISQMLDYKHVKKIYNMPNGVMIDTILGTPGNRQVTTIFIPDINYDYDNETFVKLKKL